jgi:hypothetical protein
MVIEKMSDKYCVGANNNQESVPPSRINQIRLAVLLLWLGLLPTLLPTSTSIKLVNDFGAYSVQEFFRKDTQ